jgi:hypothetical protein
MKKIVLGIASVLSVVLISEAAFATSASINARIKNQEFRIQKGCDNGQITNGEEKTLKNEQKNIKKMISQLSNSQGGALHNKKKVHAALNRSSVHIFEKRYNNKTKPRESSQQES